ncbi:hypothetical protein [Amorphus coralli]|uniref:hypothetical protein n=1 Tax=Amorphus coralli TaxID=340680 RepID=UPI000378916C|nr:hypothetical protein [Amorphus coralli]
MSTDKGQVERATGEGTDLWRLITAPTIWAVHFLVCYVGAAIYCEKAGRASALLPVTWFVAATTAVALLGLGLVFLSLWRVRGFSVVGGDLNYLGNTPEERHRFLSHVSMMLCVLSAIGVVFVAMPAFMLGTCR